MTPVLALSNAVVMRCSLAESQVLHVALTSTNVPAQRSALSGVTRAADTSCCAERLSQRSVQPMSATSPVAPGDGAELVEHDTRIDDRQVDIDSGSAGTRALLAVIA